MSEEEVRGTPDRYFEIDPGLIGVTVQYRLQGDDPSDPPREEFLGYTYIRPEGDSYYILKKWGPVQGMPLPNINGMTVGGDEITTASYCYAFEQEQQGFESAQQFKAWAYDQSTGPTPENSMQYVFFETHTKPFPAEGWDANPCNG